jgi:hypothetical protein
MVIITLNAPLSSTSYMPTVSGTVQHNADGPGIEDYRSTKFAASIRGAAPAYVYGYTRDVSHTCSVWTAGERIEQSWLHFNANSTTTVDISLVDSEALIEKVVVYPKDAGVTQVISGGVLTLTIPTNVRLRVEVNDDRREVLSLFSSPLNEELSKDYIDWTDTVVTVDSVAIDQTGYITVTNHPWGNPGSFFRAIINSTGALPTSNGDTQLQKHEPSLLVVLTDSTVQLVDEDLQVIVWSTAGTGTITIAKAFWDNTNETLYFPPGVHTISRLFAVESNCTFYLEDGAVVIGSFDLAGADGVVIQGSGVLDCSYATTATVNEQASFSDKLGYCAFLANEFVKVSWDNAVKGITIVNTPFHLNKKGVWSFRNVHLISPWELTSDGPEPAGKEAGDLRRESVDCYVFCADDAMKFATYESPGPGIFSGSFVITTSNSCFHGLYKPRPIDPAATTQITDCHAMHLGQADNGIYGSPSGIGRYSILKTLMDGLEEQAIFGHTAVTVTRLKVWGPLAGRLLVLGNFAYPYASAQSPAQEKYGQLYDWTFNQVTTEEVPGQISLIEGLDANNTPHDISFTQLQIGGTSVKESNASTFIETNEFVYNLTYDEVPTINLNPSELFSSSSITLLFGEDVPSIYATAVGSVASATAGQGVSTEVPPLTVSFFVGTATASGTSEPIDPPRTSPTELPIFSLSVPTSAPALEQIVAIVDHEIIPILIELDKIDNNIAKASSNSKVVWSQNVLDSIQIPAVSRTIIKINAANYSKFTRRADSSSVKAPTPRRRF